MKNSTSASWGSLTRSTLDKVNKPGRKWISVISCWELAKLVADQIIAATSRILGLPLMTADRRLLDYSGIEAVW